MKYDVPILGKKETKMPEKSPETYTLITYLWVFGLSAAGGAVAFYRRMKTRNVATFNTMEFIGECSTSAFAGVITFYTCESAGIGQLTTAAFVGIAGHMGSRAINNLESFFEAKFPSRKVVEAKEEQE